MHGQFFSRQQKNAQVTVVNKHIGRLGKSHDSSSIYCTWDSMSLQWLDVTILVVCALSIVGSLTIILSYVLFRDLRGAARLMLVYLSFTDLTTAVSNAVGIAIKSNTTTTSCQIQAGFAIYGSISSFLWTMFIAIYLYINVTYERSTLNRRLINYVFHPLAWGLPLVIVATAAGLDVLGVDMNRLNSSENGSYARPTVTAGWCYIRSTHNFTTIHGHVTGYDRSAPKWFNHHWQDFWIMMAGGAWELLSYIVCPVAYILTVRHIYLESRLDDTSFSHDVITEAEVRSINRKLTFVPLVYFLLHIWSTVRIILYFSRDYKSLANKGLLLLEGIGDSAQGIANCVLFCILTRNVRELIFFCCRKPLSRNGRIQAGHREREPLLQRKA
ncbi:G-protein coupled receptor 157-like [Oscarella lobularis]|uniref:G-protein coupled receptor 157-like n=1 Tax=Oscarella lobularis TaxID=121494 RepID=UPI003313CF6C